MATKASECVPTDKKNPLQIDVLTAPYLRSQGGQFREDCQITLLVKSVYDYFEAFEFWINQCVDYLITASRIMDNFLLRKGKASRKNWIYG